jgi:mono/diheme cytochrome c family protein
MQGHLRQSSFAFGQKEAYVFTREAHCLAAWVSNETPPSAALTGRPVMLSRFRAKKRVDRRFCGCLDREVLKSGVLLLLGFTVGCSRLPDSVYALRADVEKLDLPAKHTAQIAAYLAAYHGTPASPRMALPKGGAEAAGPEESESAGAPPKGVDAYPRIDKPGFDRLHLAHGRDVYTRQCAGCHGTTGDGKGPAAEHLNPPPRDYRNGIFKFASTTRGSKPRRDDLRRIVIYGAKGTSMPAFRFLPEEDREAVLDYVQILSARGELEINLIREATDELVEEDDFDPATVAGFVTDIDDAWARAEEEIVRPLTVNPAKTPETVRDGAVAFAEMYCVKCHNRDAAGSKSADVGVDAWGRIAYPANLAMGMLHGGRRPEDIYRRIFSGINGTPMPASKDPNTVIGETAEERSERIWHLVHFITEVIENNGIPADEQAAIDEVIGKGAAPAEPAAPADDESASLPPRAGPDQHASIPAVPRPGHDPRPRERRNHEP